MGMIVTIMQQKHAHFEMYRAVEAGNMSACIAMDMTVITNAIVVVIINFIISVIIITLVDILSRSAPCNFKNHRYHFPAGRHEAEDNEDRNP